MYGPESLAPGAARDSSAILQRRQTLRAIARSSADADGIAAFRDLVALDAAVRADDDRRRADEFDRLVRVHASMGRLYRCAAPEDLIEAAAREVCAAIGVTRALISRVRGNMWVPSVVYAHPSIDPEIGPFRAFLEGTEIPLSHLLVETELARRRRPVLVTDPAHHPGAHAGFVAASRSTSYVAAPIAPTHRVIGFLHADRFGEDRACDERDRDALWAFAEHFGLLFERLVLLERLEEQRNRLRTALAESSDEIDELTSAEVALVRRGALVASGMTPARGASRVASLLTERECEILDLVTEGLTNAAIAQRLALAEGTVKSHLKRILRRLHVTSRSEAVAKYLHLKRLDEARRL